MLSLAARPWLPKLSPQKHAWPACVPKYRAPMPAHILLHASSVIRVNGGSQVNLPPCLVAQPACLRGHGFEQPPDEPRGMHGRSHTVFAPWSWKQPR